MNNHYYIVDSSYIIYYSANSAFSEYVRENDIPDRDCTPDFNPILDNEFTYLFEQKFKRCIEKPIQSIIPFIDKSKYIFCLDCPRKNIWRRDFYPLYKIQRDMKDTSKDKFNIGPSFQYAYEKIIPDICDEWGSNILKCNYAEGDDCIAVATKYILFKNNFNKVIIISCDKDMVQLANDRTTIITSECLIRKPKTELEHAIKSKIKEDISANDFLLWKIILGDKSDGIPNIKPQVGNKKAFKLLQNKDELKKLLTEDIDVAKAFKRNKKLISLKEIPEEVESLILNELKTEVFKEDIQLETL
ncbi:hypothetical protein [Candidatus Ruminimicrobium bovinum]|uniref:hypothetical protein n=1 Tax=Candidatus Ruminimicrobium bovinum TaxID=3242779 RepID=UPI0039B9AD11